MRIENLTFSYDEQLIFDRLNMTVEKDRLNVIVGPNGAGKSTLLDIITATDNRSYLVDRPEFSDIMYQTQGVPLLSSLTGEDVIDFLLNIALSKKEAAEKKEFVLKWPVIQKISGRKIGAMSGGERKLLITFCLCEINRLLYVFDEPTSGVDPHYTREMLHRFEVLAQDHTVIMSTHDIDSLRDIDCWIHFLAHQRIVFSGTYDDFISLSTNSSYADIFEKISEF